jgi:hypothetical protein
MVEKITSETKYSLFNIFSGTTSHLDEFTIHRWRNFEVRGTFQPFIHLASFDYYAMYYPVTTLDPEEVAVSDLAPWTNGLAFVLPEWSHGTTSQGSRRIQTY